MDRLAVGARGGQLPQTCLFAGQNSIKRKWGLSIARERKMKFLLIIIDNRKYTAPSDEASLQLLTLVVVALRALKNGDL